LVAHIGGETQAEVFENRALKRIFGSKRDEVRGEWRKLYNEQLNDLYSSSIIVLVIKPRSIILVGPVECMGNNRRVFRFMVRKPSGSRMWGYGLDRAGSRKGPLAGTCEYGNELYGEVNSVNKHNYKIWLNDGVY